MSAKDFKHHMLNELRELERLIRNDCGIDNGLYTSYEPEELKWFEKLHELQELCEGKKADASENTLPIHGVISRFPDEVIDSVIHELNAYGHEYDHYEYGLPTYDQHMDNMRNLVKVKLNGL